MYLLKSMKLVFEILSDSLLALNQLDKLSSSELAVIINELRLLDIKKSLCHQQKE